MLDVAVACYERAIAHGPATGCVAVENLSVVKTDLGTRAKLAGATDQAVKLYTEALQLNPAYHPAYFNLGVVESERGDYARALEYYQMAIARNPHYSEALVNVGVIHKVRFFHPTDAAAPSGTVGDVRRWL
jgi:tetratricopeptide (TPR) repeat protein